jgi:zinc/manganese transport system substrate-binding protein
MRRFLALVIGALLLFGARHADAKVRVVTSIETLATLAREVGGDRVTVESLGRGYSDPHFIEPRPSLVTVLNKADLLAYVGLELEIGWLPPLVTQSRNARIQAGAPGNLDCSTLIPVLDIPAEKVDRSMGDIHPRGNPHYWIPPDNALRIAAELAARLKVLDPSGTPTYDARLKRFRAEVARRLPAWLEKTAPLRGQKIVTYHKSWTYLSAWLGMVEVGYLEPKPGVPPSPRHLASLIALMKRERITRLLMEMFYPRRTAEMVASRAGARLLVMPSDVGAFPYITDYFKLVDAAIDMLVR